MSNRAVISTPDAPEAIGPYSQAIKVGNTAWLSGQIPLIPGTMQVVEGDITAQATQVFKNLEAVAAAAGGTLNDAVKSNQARLLLRQPRAIPALLWRWCARPRVIRLLQPWLSHFPLSAARL